MFGRKVRTPQGRVLGNAQAERSDTGATENTPPMAGSKAASLPDQVRVKWWGKSPPRSWRHDRQGKRHPEQGQIGGHEEWAPEPLLNGCPDRWSSGRLHEARGNSRSREMIVTGSVAIRVGTESGLSISSNALSLMLHAVPAQSFFQRTAPVDR
jgi:hypothetical protein